VADLQKLIQMVASPRSSTRYEGCEELRVAGQSSEAAILALEKALDDPDHDVAEAARQALAADVHMDVMRTLGRPVKVSQADTQRLETARKLASIILTTTQSLENRPAAEYLGVISSEIVMGTGFLSEFTASFADFFGTKSTMFRDKLAEAKDAALTDIRNKAHAMGADAILALDLDYSVLEHNMLMVVASGTAVRLAPLHPAP
jgi:uncharacterized protein YbjQ (UPF0145 family)